jgi:Copper transport outer membrane protein, MctB
MFDLRYHVISLAAVFLALVLGILIGVAISDPSLADRTELAKKRDEVARLQDELDAAEQRSQQQQAAADFVAEAYPTVMHDRLAGKHVAVVFIGSVENKKYKPVQDALDDAGAEIVRMRALRVPLPEDAVQGVLSERPKLAAYVGGDHVTDLGRDLGRELADGGDTPLWDALADSIVEQRRGSAKGEVDGIVILRSAAPQQEGTAHFLQGLYAGMKSAGPVVAAEVSGAEQPASVVYAATGLSTVDDIDTRPGKVALAVLLSGGAAGHYALGVLPTIPPVEPASTQAGG